MKRTLVLALFLSSSLFASDRAIDCTIGDDSHGGKWCHYVLSQCYLEDAEAAVTCAVEKHNSTFVGGKISSMAVAFNPLADEFVVTVQSGRKSYQRIVTVELRGDVVRPVTIR